MEKLFADFFYNLVQFPFTRSEIRPECYHQKLNIRVILRDATDLQLAIWNLGDFKKIPEMPRIDG